VTKTSSQGTHTVKGAKERNAKRQVIYYAARGPVSVADQKTHGL
jgi:hypothetical protein